MDNRLCKNNYFNGKCVVKNCTKFHLRRADEETILFDTYANLAQHQDVKNAKIIPATFPKGIKLHVLNITDRPLEWTRPIKQDHMEIHNILGFNNQLDPFLQSNAEFTEDTKQAIAALLDIKDFLYRAFSVNIDKLDESFSTIPAGATLLSSILSMYSKKQINPSLPLFIQAAEHDSSLHKLLNQEGIKNTPIIWRNHNSMKQNYTSTFPDSATNNHYFQISPSAKPYSKEQIQSLIKNNMTCKILATSRAGFRTYQPHDLLHSICNIHQAILDSGIKQELYTTNERLVDNVISIFPQLLSPSQRNGNSRIIGNRATATMFKWNTSLEISPPKPKSPTAKPIPALMEIAAKPSPKPQRELKRTRKEDSLDQATSRPAKIIKTTYHQDHQSLSLSLPIPDDQREKCKKLFDTQDFGNWILQQITAYIHNQQEVKENIDPAQPQLL